jgi:hypothetical protein
VKAPVYARFARAMPVRARWLPIFSITVAGDPGLSTK